LRLVVNNQNPKKERKKTGLAIIAVAVLVLCGVITHGRDALLQEKEAKEKLYHELQEKYQSELERNEFLEERRAYMQTTRYIEEMARKKLGLVYENEIIFRPAEEE